LNNSSINLVKNSQIFQIFLFKIPGNIREFFNATLKKIGVPQEIQTNYILYINKKTGTKLYVSFSTTGAVKAIR